MLLALPKDLFMIFIGFLLNSYGILKSRAEPLIRLILMIFVFRRVTDVWGIDLYLLCPNLFLQNSGRSAGLLILYWLISCRKNIGRDIDLK